MSGEKDGLMEVWSPKTSSTIINFNPLPLYVGGRGARACLLDKHIYACGGSKVINSTWQVFDSCRTASINGGDWKLAAKLNKKRNFHTITTVGDELLVTGGSEGHNKLRSVEIYSNQSGWQIANWTLPYGDSSHCVLALSETQVIFISGQGNDNAMDVKKFDIRTGSHVDLPAPSGSTGGHHYCVREANFIYASDQISERQHKVWKYSILEERWTNSLDVYIDHHEALHADAHSQEKNLDHNYTYIFLVLIEAL